MTGRAWPIAAVPADTGDPVYAGRHLRQTTVAPFVGLPPATRSLGARGGVRAGTRSTVIAVTATTWTVHPCAGVADVEAAGEAGPYSWAFDEDVTGAMRAAHQTYARWDGLYVQIDDPAEDETEAPAARIVYQYGPEQASPALPSGVNIPARSLRLCKIVVPQVGGGSPSVVWDPPFLTGAGGVVPVSSTTELVALSAYATADHPVMAMYSGALYKVLSTGVVLPDTGATAFPFAANWATHTSYGAAQSIKDAEGWVRLTGAALRTGVNVSSATATLGTLAAGHRPAVQAVLPCTVVVDGSTAVRAAILQIATTGVVTLNMVTAASLVQDTTYVTLSGMFKAA